MRTLSINLTAGQTTRMNIGGTYFALIDSSAPMDVDFYRNNANFAKASGVEFGYFSEPLEGFTELDFTSASTQTIKVAIATGSGGYNRLAGTVSANIIKGSSFNDLAPVTVGVAAVVVAAANASRKALRVYNGGTATVYFGGPGVTTANGVVAVLPGQTWIEDDAPAAALYGISGTAGQAVRVQEVL